MADAPALRPSPPRPYDADPVRLLGALRPEQAEMVAQLVRERDHLFLLHEALIDLERTPALEARVRIFGDAIRKIGFNRVVITLRDDELNPTLIVTAGLTAEEERELREKPASGEAWRRRLASLERFRISQSYYLDARDEWVAAEFGNSLPSRLEPGEDPSWTPRDALLVPLKGTDGRIIATLVLDEPLDRSRPSLSRVRTVELFGQQVAFAIEQARLVEIAQGRAERLQRLHEVGGILARSLEEREIIRELARQVQRILPCDGVVIAQPDPEAHMVTTALRLVRGVERPRPPQPLGHGMIAEVVRSGRAVRVDDFEPSRVSLAAADDLVGDGGPARSVLAAPMMLGLQLVGVIGVHASARAAFTADDEEVLLIMGSQAATAIVNARFYAESQRERRQGEALADVARAVSASLRPDEVLHLTLRHAMALLRAEGACVTLRRDEELDIMATIGCADGIAGMRLPVSGSVSGRTLRQGAYTIVNDAAQAAELYPPAREGANIRKTVIVPLVTAQGAIGTLSVINRPYEFTDEDARILHRLADHVAVAIVNARLFEEAAEATREWSVAFDAIASGMVVLDAAGRITRCNARSLQLAELPDAAALLGRDFGEAILDCPSPCPDCVHVLAIREQSVARGTHRAMRRGRVYAVVAAPHPSGGAVVTFEDVTSHHILAERHRRVVETASDAIIITDLRRRIAFANPAAHELFGRDDDLEGTPVRDTIPSELRDQVAELESRGFEGEPQRYETVILRPDGDRRLVSVSTAPLREVGQITGIVACLRDITDERRARDAVAQSEARYRNLFETASDAIYTLDARGAITSCNHATCALAGVAREQLLGRTARVFLSPAEVAQVKEHFQAALGGESRRYECHLARADGERRLLSVTNSPIRHGPEVVGVLGIARDVTLERERAAALERSEARYTRLVESASDAIFTVDREGRFTSMNRALEQSTGRSREELYGEAFTVVIDPRDRELTWGILADTLAGERRRAEFRYLGPGDEVRAGSIITSPIVESDDVTGCLGIVRDVTDEKRLTDQLLQQEKLAAVGQLVSGVAHELNNPLAGVMAFSQLLLAAPAGLQSEQMKALETIHGEARRAAKIVSNLLTFARQHAPERTVTDLNQVFLDTLELRRYALRVQQIELEVALAADLPSTWADAFQLQQVVLNLIGNAEQALHGWQGERRIAVRTWREGETLVACIADTGPGITPQDIDRIFNPFFTTKPVGQGTGLGLSISDGIVREHGGRIRVESQPGAGASFFLELPIVPPPVQALAAAPSPAPEPTRAYTVLVVDDEPAIRAAVSAWLGSLGHTVDTAPSGAAALEMLGTRRFDAILLDLRMPDMSGDAFYAELRERAPAMARRVVFVTGDIQSDSTSAFIHATGRPCLSKPFSLDELGAVLFADLGEEGES